MELHEVDYKAPGGKLIRVHAGLEGGRIRSIALTGDFFLHPEDRILVLEKALVGVRLDRSSLCRAVAKSLARCQMAGISPDDVVTALLKLV